VLDRIRASVPALPPAEQRVAQLVLADPQAFARLPVGELAQRAAVSKPTVVRFCRSVGYDGLADFKLRLAGSAGDGVPFVHRAVDEGDGAADIVVKVVDNALAALLRWRGAAAAGAVERAVQALARAGREGRRIEFHGVGNSGIVALDAQHKFFRLGVTASAVVDTHMQVMSATLLRPGDCVVLISNSGRTRDLLDVAEIARRKGATLLAITASASPLARAVQGSDAAAAGHVLLAADHPEDSERYSPMVSRLLHLLVIDILTTGVALSLGAPALQPVLQEIKTNLRQRRYVGEAPGTAQGPAGGRGRRR
jgi:RpiR family carbohydrate utilization transcriptional regulator